MVESGTHCSEIIRIHSEINFHSDSGFQRANPFPTEKLVSKDSMAVRVFLRTSANIATFLGTSFLKRSVISDSSSRTSCPKSRAKSSLTARPPDAVGARRGIRPFVMICHHRSFFHSFICVAAKAAKKSFRFQDIAATFLFGSSSRMNRRKNDRKQKRPLRGGL
jgi:hypothetical protein